MNSPARWRLAGKKERPLAETLLRSREGDCVAACSRFRAPGRGDRLWLLEETRRGAALPQGLLLLHNRMLFPVAGRPGDGEAGQDAGMPAPGFLRRLADRISLHAVHGPGKDTEFLVRALEDLNFPVWDEFNYDLMGLDGPPEAESLHAGPPGLVLGVPGKDDLEELFWLQAAYEREEVLPRGAAFNANVCRLHLEKLLAEEFFLAAWFEGRIAGKIYSNAESFTRRQVGGVYVLPDYRNLGIARRLAAEAAARLAPAGKGISLFVKSANAAAKRAYAAAGFVKTGDYRICYY